jgi:glycosyltransferase involved in cell wall biosynthesis
MPCYNEEQGLREVITRIPACVDEVVVADNNSTDRTAEVALQHGAKVVLEPRQGYGAAYKTGLAATTGDIVATLDGDGTYPAEAIPGLIDALLDRDLDFLSAARFPLSDSRAMGFTNRAGNWVLTAVAWVLFGTRMADSQSGMWVFRREVLKHLKPTSDGMPFSEELKIEAIRHPQVRFGEQHIEYRPRIGEVKLRKWRDGWENTLFMIRKRFR